MAESKKKQTDVSPVIKRATYWLTLRSDGKIDVWLTAPKRAFGAWVSPDYSARILTAEGIKTPYAGTWERDFALKEVRTVPETPLECIRVGTDEPNFAP